MTCNLGVQNNEHVLLCIQVSVFYLKNKREIYVFHSKTMMYSK